MEVVGVRCGHNCSVGHHQVCGEFFSAARTGSITVSEKRDGWHYADMPVRQMSWRGRYYGLPRGCKDHTGELYLLTEICPFCGGELPAVVPSKVGVDE